MYDKYGWQRGVLCRSSQTFSLALRQIQIICLRFLTLGKSRAFLNYMLRSVIIQAICSNILHFGTTVSLAWDLRPHAFQRIANLAGP